MKINSKYLYELLPAYYRVLDDEQGEPLKALIEILAREAGLVEANIDQLYENWFIETCEEWVVPYIGDLLGVRGVHQINNNAVYSRRAYVANTLSYRRRKGTAPVLEQLALDITGWRTRAVEFFQLLATTQTLNHLRLHNLATPDLRQMNQLDLLNTAFDTISHTVEVGRISKGLGQYNIQNIGLYLWRLESYPLESVNARLLETSTDIPEGAYTFNVLGLDSHLFNPLQTEREITHLAEEINVPGLLRRRGLFDELEALRQAQVNNQEHHPYFFGTTPVFNIFINNSPSPIPFEEILICNLRDWHEPPLSKTYSRINADGSTSMIDQPITVAVDPHLGRMIFSNLINANDVWVNYNYGFSADVGGGPYDRADSLLELKQEEVDWQVGVSKTATPVASETIHSSIWDAVQEWNNLTSQRVGLITIMDSRTYEEELTGIQKIIIPEGKKLYIVAADWPNVDVPGSLIGEEERRLGSFNPENVRPHILGHMEVEGTAPSAAVTGGELILNGLLVEGKMTILTGNLGACQIQHGTLVPEHGGLEVANQEKILQLSIHRSISGPISVLSEDTKIDIHDSIIDNKDGMAVEALTSHLDIQQCTVWGEISTQSLEASNCIFNHLLNISRRQSGCVRFSYLPIDSRSPRRFRCQPELEIQSQIQTLEEKGSLTFLEKEAIKNQVLNRIFPIYNSENYGHHACGQLSHSSAQQIHTGADNASEMGVFNHLQQPQRLANLNIALEEYLRLGLEAGILFVT